MGKAAVLILLLSALAGGCSATHRGADRAYFSANGTSERLEDLQQQQTFKEQVLFAALSSSAYDYTITVRDGRAVSTCTAKRKSATLAEYFAKGNEDTTYLPPFLKEVTQEVAAYEPPPLGWDVGGLGYAVFVEQVPSGPRRAIIVFRGTDAPQVGDWDSNFRLITRVLFFLRDQYDQLERVLGRIVGNMRKLYGDDLIIYTAGHSLGGGLAQFAAYGTPALHGEAHGVRRVYAFDPSPVTGWFSWPLYTRREAARGLTVYRAYDRGEILATFRGLQKIFVPLRKEDPQIIEIRYDLLSGDAIAQHSIRKLAQQLWEKLGKPEGPGMLEPAAP